MINGINGYEDNYIYTFSGVRIDTNYGLQLIKKGDVSMLPKKEIPLVSQIFGFEINLNPRREIDNAYFITKALYTLEELKNNNFKIYEKIIQAKIDQLNGPNTQVANIMKNQRMIGSDVSLSHV